MNIKLNILNVCVGVSYVFAVLGRVCVCVMVDSCKNNELQTF